MPRPAPPNNILPHLVRFKTCVHPHEQCSAAYEQWSRLISCNAFQTKVTNQLRSLFNKIPTDHNVIRLLNSINQAANNQLSPSESEGEVARDFSSPGDDAQEDQDHTPWKEDSKMYQPGLLGLHEEIVDFYNYMAPRPEERYMRSDVVSRMKLIIKSLWPNAEVKVYGSFETGLYLATSDIDLVVKSNDLEPQTALTLLEQQLIKQGDYEDIKIIKTSVPIVKATDKQTAIRVDVSFNVSTGVSSAEFIKEMMVLYPELKYLVFVLKQFLLSRGLLESFNGGISSYCLILLIVSYLQLHPEDRHVENHGDRLIKFLELYGRHFNYLHCGIRICGGGSYFRKGTEDGRGEVGSRFSLLCIEDPFNTENDVGQGCFGAIKVREEFDRAFRELSDGVLPQYAHIQPPSTSLLGRILNISPDVVTYRRYICDRYRPFCLNSPPAFPMTAPLFGNCYLGGQPGFTNFRQPLILPPSVLPYNSNNNNNNVNVSGNNNNGNGVLHPTIPNHLHHHQLPPPPLLQHHQQAWLGQPPPLQQPPQPIIMYNNTNNNNNNNLNSNNNNMVNGNVTSNVLKNNINAGNSNNNNNNNNNNNQQLVQQPQAVPMFNNNNNGSNNGNTNQIPQQQQQPQQQPYYQPQNMIPQFTIPMIHPHTRFPIPVNYMINHPQLINNNNNNIPNNNNISSINNNNNINNVNNNNNIPNNVNVGSINNNNINNNLGNSINDNNNNSIINASNHVVNNFNDADEVTLPLTAAYSDFNQIQSNLDDKSDTESYGSQNSNITSTTNSNNNNNNNDDNVDDFIDSDTVLEAEVMTVTGASVTTSLSTSTRQQRLDDVPQHFSDIGNNFSNNNLTANRSNDDDDDDDGGDDDVVDDNGDDYKSPLMDTLCEIYPGTQQQQHQKPPQQQQHQQQQQRTLQQQQQSTNVKFYSEMNRSNSWHSTSNNNINNSSSNISPTTSTNQRYGNNSNSGHHHHHHNHHNRYNNQKQHYRNYNNNNNNNNSGYNNNYNNNYNNFNNNSSNNSNLNSNSRIINNHHNNNNNSSPFRHNNNSNIVTTITTAMATTITTMNRANVIISNDGNNRNEQQSSNNNKMLTTTFTAAAATTTTTFQQQQMCLKHSSLSSSLSTTSIQQQQRINNNNFSTYVSNNNYNNNNNNQQSSNNSRNNNNRRRNNYNNNNNNNNIYNNNNNNYTNKNNNNNKSQTLASTTT